jgi:hypothetical protein
MGLAKKKAKAGAQVLFGVLSLLAGGEGRFAEGRLLHCDGSCKRHAVFPSLAEATQLQATVNSRQRRLKSQKPSRVSALVNLCRLSGGVELCVCEASLKAINMEIIRRHMYGWPATFHLSLPYWASCPLEGG